jgi:hypothetical protein
MNEVPELKLELTRQMALLEQQFCQQHPETLGLEGLTNTWIDTLATLEHGGDERLIIIRTLAWEVKRLQKIISEAENYKAICKNMDELSEGLQQ